VAGARWSRADESAADRRHLLHLMCDTLVALPSATASGCTLFAKNSDRPPDEAQDVRWFASRDDQCAIRATHIEVPALGRPTLGCLLSVPRWCWGAEHGVNTAGVAIGNEAIYTTLDPRSAPPALTGMDLVRLGLERSSSAREALDVMTGLLERFGQGGTGHDPAGYGGAKAYWSSFLIADVAEGFVLETSGRHWSSEQVSDVRAISNRTTITAFDAEHRHPRQPVAQLVDPRWNASNDVLARRPVTVDALVDHLRSHDSCALDGWSVCMHAIDDRGVPVENTTASMIAELRPDGTSIAWVLIGHPCRHDYVQVRLGDPFELLA
jgi:secernin